MLKQMAYTIAQAASENGEKQLPIMPMIIVANCYFCRSENLQTLSEHLIHKNNLL